MTNLPNIIEALQKLVGKKDADIEALQALVAKKDADFAGLAECFEIVEKEVKVRDSHVLAYSEEAERLDQKLTRARARSEEKDNAIATLQTDKGDLTSKVDSLEDELKQRSRLMDEAQQSLNSERLTNKETQQEQHLEIQQLKKEVETQTALKFSAARYLGLSNQNIQTLKDGLDQKDTQK